MSCGMHLYCSVIARNFARILSWRRRAKHGGGGSTIVKVPGDVPPTRVYFFGLLV